MGMTCPETPESIDLPDGRRFPVQQLLQQRGRTSNINLLTYWSQQLAPRGSRSRQRYTLADRRWQARVTLPELIQRYGLTVRQATMLRHNSRYVLDKLGISYSGPDGLE